MVWKKNNVGKTQCVSFRHVKMLSLYLYYYYSCESTHIWNLDLDFSYYHLHFLATRTPFHADVFRSYSWSANICGRKKWLLYPPGQEEFLRDTHGNLSYDVTSAELRDRGLFPNSEEACQPLEIIQEAGEIIFVPSGWHHQVYNLVRNATATTSKQLIQSAFIYQITHYGLWHRDSLSSMFCLTGGHHLY